MSTSKYVVWMIIISSCLPLCYAKEWKTYKDSKSYRPNIIRNNLNCTTKFSNEIVQLIIDYARWRNVAMLYIVDDSINSGCNMKAIRGLLDCFNLNGISISLQKRIHKHFNRHCKVRNILVVSFLKAAMDHDHYLHQANFISSSGGYCFWLNIYPSRDASLSMEKNAIEILRSSLINVAIDMVIAVEMPRSSLTENPKYVFCKRNNQVLSISEKNQDVETYLPFKQSNVSNHSEYEYLKDFCKNSNIYDDVSFCIVQIYKIRKLDNTSLVIRPLGQWQYETGTQALKSFQTVEKRRNFYGFPIKVGQKKFSQDANIADENIIEDDNDEDNMEKILDFMEEYLNTRAEIKMYPTLGLKGATGNWSGLLGAVIQQEVDVGLDSVIKTPERYNDMSFTLNIMNSIRNIYLKPEESHSARDIYLQPFGDTLLLCVLSTVAIFATVMSVYIIITRKMNPDQSKTGTFHSAISDALLWCFAIISMQGSLVQPKSFAGNLIVVTSLLFALIIYNSYSAFITSILSVKLTEIRTVDDLLESNYDIGYTKNSQDEIFLRSMNNESELNQIYLRGYLHNNINNITEGLLKATKGNYGFFATGHIARKQLLKICGYKCRYDIMEIPVISTQHSVAYPMSSKSPYRKIINMCLIRMTESGVHDYIGSLIEPRLPQCEKQKSYQSARINDLTTSFVLLGTGFFLGLLIIALECFWKKKRQVYSKMRGNFKDFHPNFEFTH